MSDVRIWHECPIDDERCKCLPGSVDVDDCEHCQVSLADDEEIGD